MLIQSTVLSPEKHGTFWYIKRFISSCVIMYRSYKLVFLDPACI